MGLLYILSGKNGITSFTFRELELLEEQGIKFTLLFTKFNKINNIPKEHWEYYVVKKSSLVSFIFVNSILFLINRNFYKSLLIGELRYFLIAAYFFNKLGINKHSICNVHVQMGDHKLILGYYINKLIKKSKLSATIHAHELYTHFRYKNLLRYSQILNNCDRVFTISDFNKDILVNDLKVNPSKIKRMYLYPSFDNQNLKVRKKFLVTGNWEYKKGYLDILDAISSIERDDFVVLIAGRAVNPNVDLDLPKLITQKGLNNKVKLLGYINETVLELMYSYCDFFILTSKTEYYSDGNPKEREGIPVALMEAIQFNLPVITTRHAGIPELVDTYLIDEGDVAELKKAIIYFLDNIKSVQDEAMANLEILKSKFNSENIQLLIEYFQTKKSILKKDLKC